ncbi:hypothetical protein E2C01_073023 [Portunus trituberculatus]|uniref:Uncharacterized protein n=1 Tax=Portunus trituberculatus TaxID=210409 RepID=A0A5B7I8S3_PORTR|nr:hypothetical protein [Portunus trituberculatus]
MSPISTILHAGRNLSTLLTSSLPVSSFSSSTAKEFSVSTHCAALRTFLLFAPEDTTHHSSWPFVSVLGKETAGTSTPSVAEFTRQNSACRSEIRPLNSSRTSEILQWNSASISETFITKASRIGELTQPAETVGKAWKAITT